MDLQAAFFAVFLMTFLSMYLPFSPLTIDLINLSRDQQLWLYQRRYLLWSVGVMAASVVIGLDLADGNRIGNWATGTFIVGGVLVLLYWTSYVPIVMSPPKTVRRFTADELGSRIPGDTVVLGIAIEGHTCAYLRDEIARPHYFVDRLGNTPLIISYCILCNSSTAFHASLNGRPLDLRCVTAFNNNIIYRDVACDNYIQQLDGRVILGPDLGRSLEMIPVVQTSWRNWSRLYPHTTLFRSTPTTIRDRLVGMMLQWMIPLPKLAKRDSPWHRLRGALDTRHPAMGFVLGVEIGEAQRAYPLNEIIDRKVINDTLEGQPIVIMSDSHHGFVQVYSRKVAGKILSFEEISCNDSISGYVDLETRTVWSVAGLAISGPLASTQLMPVAHFNKLFWFSWAMFKPRTDLWHGPSPKRTQAGSL